MDPHAIAGYHHAGAAAHEVRHQLQDVDAAQHPNPKKNLLSVCRPANSAGQRRQLQEAEEISKRVSS